MRLFHDLSSKTRRLPARSRGELILKTYLIQSFAAEVIDVTLLGRCLREGTFINHGRQATIEDIFAPLGYAIEDGREIETDFN